MIYFSYQAINHPINFRNFTWSNDQSLPYLDLKFLLFFLICFLNFPSNLPSTFLLQNTPLSFSILQVFINIPQCQFTHHLHFRFIDCFLLTWILINSSNLWLNCHLLRFFICFIPQYYLKVLIRALSSSFPFHLRDFLFLLALGKHNRHIFPFPNYHLI